MKSDTAQVALRISKAETVVYIIELDGLYRYQDGIYVPAINHIRKLIRKYNPKANRFFIEETLSRLRDSNRDRKSVV